MPVSWHRHLNYRRFQKISESAPELNDSFVTTFALIITAQFSVFLSKFFENNKNWRKVSEIYSLNIITAWSNYWIHHKRFIACTITPKIHVFFQYFSFLGELASFFKLIRNLKNGHMRKICIFFATLGPCTSIIIELFLAKYKIMHMCNISP